MIPCIVLLVLLSWPTHVTEKTACTQIKGFLGTSLVQVFLCVISESRDIGKTIQSIKWIGYQSIFDYLDSLIPYIILQESPLPDVAQKTFCIQNVAMDVTFHLRYVPAFNDVYILRNPWKNAKILSMRFFWNAL